MTYDGAPGPVTTDGFIAAQALTVVGAPPVGYEWAVFGAQFTVTLASVTRNLGPFTVWFWVSQGANLMVVGIAGDCTSRVFDELVIRRGNGSV